MAKLKLGATADDRRIARSRSRGAGRETGEAIPEPAKVSRGCWRVLSRADRVFAKLRRACAPPALRLTQEKVVKVQELKFNI